MTTTTHSTAAIMSLLDEAEWRQTQMDVGGLIQASALGKVALRYAVRRLMKRGARLRHDSGLYVCICDPSYEFLQMNLSKISWLERHCPPLDQELIMFGVIEAWEEASRRPTRQLVLFMTPKWDVFAYDSGILFFLAPSMAQFWHGAIVLEYWNALFPVEVRSHVRQHAHTMDDLVMVFHQLDYEKQVLEARRDKNTEGPRTFAKSVNSYVRAILESERRIREGKIPMTFVDRDSLRANSLAHIQATGAQLSHAPAQRVLSAPPSLPSPVSEEDPAAAATPPSSAATTPPSSVVPASVESELSSSPPLPPVVVKDVMYTAGEGDVVQMVVVV
ncbi:protein UL38 [Human betaherpesvirus 5]|uniref:Protein UL38 n=1 Tax=Human cytomegalovirus TaxID=10359 RepID=A0A0G2TGH2_HCMV|nr:protein UL38 [Human betaherpesvirus 5]